MKLPVRNWENQVVGEVEVPDPIFTYPPRPHLVWEVVKAYLAGLRRGTHATKTRGMVSGGGKKPWRQKGTGRARHGSIRSPLWRHGGTVFGPQPRDYTLKVNVKAKKNALKSVLSERLAQGRLLVLESLEVPSFKTKEVMARLAKLGLAGEKVLFVDSYDNLNLLLATRNRPELGFQDAGHLHVYEVLNAQHVVFSSKALTALAEVLVP
jgi:large subunit ribosomal protein L4